MDLHNAVEFEWDDAKSDACFTYRGFGFSYAIRAFRDNDRIVGRDHRRDYDEDRYRLLGTIEGPGVRGDLHDARFRHAYHFGPQGQREGGSGV